VAQTNLPVLSYPGFPQVLDSVIGQEIERVERVLAQHQLSPCSHESPESSRGACDGGEPCSDTATVHDLETEQEFCLKHFGARQ
jgi:hypothetical protein